MVDLCLELVDSDYSVSKRDIFEKISRTRVVVDHLNLLELDTNLGAPDGNTSSPICARDGLSNGPTFLTPSHHMDDHT
jgi:hypothetical protein